MVTRTSGFEWAAEKPGAPTFVEQKWGWRSVEPGAWLELEVHPSAGQEGRGCLEAWTPGLGPCPLGSPPPC